VSAQNIIGVGFKFPISVNAKGGLSYSRGPERIQDAIWIVLSTAPGERVMRESFGAGAADHVFDSNSDLVRTRLAATISEALAKWEPRITVVNVSVQQGNEPSQVLISVDYQISSTNELFNLVYPFYLQEGAG